MYRRGIPGLLVPSAGAAVAVLVGGVHRGLQCYWRTPRWMDHALPVPCAARTAHIGAACTAHAIRIRSPSIVELAIRLSNRVAEAATVSYEEGPDNNAVPPPRIRLPRPPGPRGGRYGNRPPRGGAGEGRRADRGKRTGRDAAGGADVAVPLGDHP